MSSPNKCPFCDSAFTNAELTEHNDLSYLHPNELLCTNGVSLYIRAGDNRKTAIVVSRFNENLCRNEDIVYYIPKFCPECGRKLQENEILTKLI